VTTLRHWLKFNAVGIIGVGVQLAVLTLLRNIFALNYLLATFLAVEATIVHNFIWHERWTWIDRTKNLNGVISLVGNLGIMWLLVSKLGWHYLVANFIAIIICSMVNFLVSDRLVFHSSR
jgi:dolichol-phosphate mannosyltransferase